MKRKKVIPRRGMPLAARTLPQFRQEAAALLVVGKGWTAIRAAKAVVKWDRYVRKMWQQGKPPCSVADHIVKWEKEKVVCPCKRRGCKGCFTRKTSRDPSDPQKGEVFESSRGNKWKVVEKANGLVYVESAGRKTPGSLAWSPSQFRNMKSVEGGSRQLSLFGGDPGRRRKRFLLQKLTLKELSGLRAFVRRSKGTGCRKVVQAITTEIRRRRRY